MSTPRPRSVTLGCVYGGLGGLLSALMLFEVLQGWGSLEMQEALEQTLAQVGAEADVDAVLPALRWLAMALLVGSIAATVFAFYAARGHQPSRVGLSLLAGLAAVTFVLSGVAGLLPAILAGLIVYLLWSAPAREWFAVVNGHTPVHLGAAPAAPHEPQRPAAGAVPPPPPYDPAQHPQHPQHVQPAQGRPKPVTLALLVAGVGSAVGAAGSGLFVLTLVVLRDEMVQQYGASELLSRQLENAGLTAEQMVSIGAWLFGAWFVASIAGLAATAWAMTRRGSGRVALLVVSVVTAGLAVLGIPIGLLWLVGAIVVIVQLMRPETKAWFGRA